MTILDDIIAGKKLEIAERRSLYPIPLLERSLYFDGPCVSLVKYLGRADLNGVIAEIKRASPSAGNLNPFISVEKLSIGYMQHGASALSVLTDGPFFKGSLEDLRDARRFNFCPILRKDFIIDEYQLYEARSYGADVVLLIARALSVDTLSRLASKARSLGLEVLLEVHDERELDAYVSDDISAIGVNARDLASLRVDHAVTGRLIERMPRGIPAVAESGIKTPETLVEFRKMGYRGFLIGELFMRSADPAKACGTFIKRTKELLHAD